MKGRSQGCMITPRSRASTNSITLALSTQSSTAKLSWSQREALKDCWQIKSTPEVFWLLFMQCQNPSTPKTKAIVSVQSNRRRRGSISAYSRWMVSTRSFERGSMVTSNGMATRFAAPMKPSFSPLALKAAVYIGFGLPVVGSVAGRISKAQSIFDIERHKVRSAICIPGQMRRPPP